MTPDPLHSALGREDGLCLIGQFDRTQTARLRRMIRSGQVVAIAWDGGFGRPLYGWPRSAWAPPARPQSSLDDLIAALNRDYFPADGAR